MASASKDLWADPKGEFLSCVYAGSVYNLHGLKDLGSNTFPKPGESFNTGHIGYHLREGKHDLILFDWQKYIKFADRFLK